MTANEALQKHTLNDTYADLLDFLAGISTRLSNDEETQLDEILERLEKELGL